MDVAQPRLVVALTPGGVYTDPTRHGPLGIVSYGGHMHIEHGVADNVLVDNPEYARVIDRRAQHDRRRPKPKVHSCHP